MSFTTSDGLRLDWQEEGSGPAVLCLPGLTRNGSDFDELAAALAGRVRLIRLTLRGRGRSDRDPDWQNYNLMIEARDVVEFLDFLGLPQVTIVGTSRGGLIAMVLAATVKGRLAGVLLNDVGPVLEAEGLGNIMGYLGTAPTVKTYPEAAFALEERMGARFPWLSPGKWLSLAERWFDQGPDGLVLNYDPKIRDALAAGFPAPDAPAPDLWPLFDALAGLPVAVVRGANSDLLSPATVAEMARRHPGLIEAEVPDRGHVPFLDEPQALAAFDALMAEVGKG
ncbi:MAG: alpha/beta hydrolase [Amaricoccus sp.]|uniref:alpha/beta fold hydrolase n=1 Tax=Amaricoccus sp. TaxID=1872485 RepID=UPI0039E3AB60